MTNYLEQIPKQLAARRKAFAAAKGNPALLPSCWAIVRTIANNINEYNRNAVIGGCTFPDRPMFLTPEDSGFLNFGATPSVLARDIAWIEAELAGRPPPELENSEPEISPGARARVGKLMAAVARTFGRNHHATRVYNLEPWLQDMYRDRLDVDFAEDLQRQIDAINAYMALVPKQIQGTGLSGKLSKGVMEAFNLFKTITGSSHQLDREKMSFIDRRSYVNTVQKIETIMIMADESLGAAAIGHSRSVIRELFELWKDANYELMNLTRQLRAIWAGTSLDERIGELADLLGAIQKTSARATDESRNPKPQLPVLRADESPPSLTRAEIAEAFQSILLHDYVLSGETALSNREIRKFGPLSVVIVPGDGQPRYCSEIRQVGTKEEDYRRGPVKATTEREADFDRRVKYPLNCVVVPIKSDKQYFLEDMADAWLEFNHVAYPVKFKEVLEAARASAPGLFVHPKGGDSKDIPASFARQMLAKLTSHFVRWAMSGVEPGEEVPGFDSFRQLALSRLNPDHYIVPVRYRPFLELFVEAGVKRRQEMWKRCLGPRYVLDRQLVAINIVQKDWKALQESLKYLPPHLTKGNNSLANGFAKTKDMADQFAGHKAMALFRKFLTDQPELKSALATVESQVSIEVETLRSQAEGLGRVFQYEEAAATMMARQASQIQEKRNAANRHIDQYLTGLMYALDSNYEAATVALSMCLTPPDERQSDDIALPAVPDEAGQAWLEENQKPLEPRFEKRKVAGEDSPGTICYDYVYYNLGLVYSRMNRHIEARMCFKGVDESCDPAKAHLIRLWAAEHAEEARQKVSPTAVKAKSATVFPAGSQPANGAKSTGK